MDIALPWSLQSALWAGLAVACAGLAMTFRRPAMRVLTANFALSMTAAAAIWAALSPSSLGLPETASPLFVALAFAMTPLLTLVLMLHLIRLLAGTTARAFPAPALLIGTGVGGAVFAFAAQRLSAAAGHAGSGPIVAALSSVGSVASYSLLAVLAYRERNINIRHRGALSILAASFALLAIRSTTNIAVASIAVVRKTPPVFGAGVSTLQIAILVMAGVAQLLAVLEEERTSILRNAEQLRAAEAAMATSQRLEALGRMAGAVAHDFNNLLSVIGLCAESARAAMPGAAEDDFREIDASSARGKALTRQLLAFARQAPEQATRFDAAAQLENMRGLLERVAGREATLVMAERGAPLPVEMDTSQFDQIVMNLVVNARDASPRGGTITVAMNGHAPDARNPGGNSPSGREFIQLSVSDTGSGIPAELVPHIFEPFFTTKKPGDGTGLGLATCDGIVRRLGGWIDVHSEPERGARFDVFLPRAL